MSSSQQNLVNDMALSYTRMNFYYSEFIREVGVFRALAMRMRHYYPIRDSCTNNGINRTIQDVINLSSIDTNFVGNRLSVFNTLVSKLTRDIGK
ncbi:hypothetical protein EPVG_00161 [Emiliania huxleyi virus 201]|nr:hypothetical protein ELVG_00142 [Emiliania huxleyi virus 203]AEP15549.1 hypothetical protein EQVG_00139 [Emiliania huxleyi virus 207]AEP15969.1 hypothetical protein ERVG_00092 [Emiliania huxleyi virus 208]AET98049.1 hypothetical protein EPVG_00161 [Emiliania huxleyi virus 201]